MYSRILVPLDGSTLAEAILPHARVVAEKFDATLVLLRVSLSTGDAMRQSMPAEPLDGGLIAVSVAEDLAEALEEAAEVYLKRMVESLARQGVRCESVVMEGDAVLALRHAVREQRIDLVAMATHGRSALRRLFQGSVAEELVHEIKVPVLLLHAEE